MVQSLKSQINSLKIVMNRDYLKLINITLYQEVIAKNISPAVSQSVIVALARAGMVFISKGPLEIIISWRELIKKQKENSPKQKELDLALRNGQEKAIRKRKYYEYVEPEPFNFDREKTKKRRF